MTNLTAATKLANTVSYIAATVASRSILPIDCHYIGSFTIRVPVLIVFAVDIVSHPPVEEIPRTNYLCTSRLSVKSNNLQDVLCTQFISNTLRNLTQPYFDTEDVEWFSPLYKYTILV